MNGVAGWMNGAPTARIYRREPSTVRYQDEPPATFTGVTV